MMLASLRISLYWLADFFYPSTCLACRVRLGPADKHICASCWNALKTVGESDYEGILRCDAIDAIHAGYYYDEVLQKSIHALKYERALSLIPKFADRLAPIVHTNPMLKTATRITAIPLNPIRKRERGYNQAELLARAVGQLAGLSYVETLQRVRHTESQTKMNTAEDRIKNVDGVFIAKADASVQDQSVILVDDIITTGSTANACAAALKKAGASKVFVLTVGRPTLG
ncbi:ComF family protein [bacterium]|nr:ComF family protein [bacterium]NUN46794.1 ComF family protein [bacterium]